MPAVAKQADARMAVLVARPAHKETCSRWKGCARFEGVSFELHAWICLPQLLRSDVY
ncbi:hypothetical protein DPMN_011940 [Dreissena polymorpha]|uniref:Uncharacterized protein n=1 Tax=Dreissena polymorpha TaxID=45954 RepID=A0A9D4N4Y5_DREPO|nr:hypothetical protein DPMN_011940 [Dreissena polymorpha]